ncbi:MAG: hypothetical protein KKG47_13730 [Proteobacteria bacterium]|nr:hypothetical protein [Pseudomonadota bacterium]MBU1736531.1 hypothetical protein [Pseudomonadota bacterium]
MAKKNPAVGEQQTEQFTEEQRHRRAWLQYALQTPQPYRRSDGEFLPAGIATFIRKLLLSG